MSIKLNQVAEEIVCGYKIWCSQMQESVEWQVLEGHDCFEKEFRWHSSIEK